MDNRFVHLHLHSEYSLQDSTLRLKPLIESVMISTKTQQGISFTSRGRVLETITR